MDAMDHVAFVAFVEIEFGGESQEFGDTHNVAFDKSACVGGSLFGLIEAHSQNTYSNFAMLYVWHIERH